MRWKKKEKYVPRDGEERVIHKFLLLPECIDYEYRWLEFAYILQRYIGVRIENGDIYGGYWVEEEYLTAENAARYKYKK